MQINSEDFPAVQLNETINLAPDGRVLSRSLMINLRNSDPNSVFKTYQELKALIDGKKDEPEKKAKNSEKKQSRKEEKKDDVCPRCGSLLVEKQGISSKNGRPYHFLSCGSWPICNFSKSIISEVEKHEPCDQDLIEVPF